MTRISEVTTLLKRRAMGLSFPIVALLLQTSAGASVACGDSASCISVRDSTYAALEGWEACDPTKPDQCIVEPGNPKDCTGVLTCTFAINADYRSEAEQAVLAAGEQSRGCYLCATPACGDGETAYCEPVSKRCMLQSTSYSQGDAGIGVSAPDTGSAIVVDAGGD